MEISFLDDLENKVQSLIALLETTRQENASLKLEISENSNKVAEIEAENSQLKQELDALKNSSVEQQGKLDSVTERIQGIISRLEAVN